MPTINTLMRRELLCWHRLHSCGVLLCGKYRQSSNFNWGRSCLFVVSWYSWKHSSSLYDIAVSRNSTTNWSCCFKHAPKRHVSVILEEFHSCNFFLLPACRPISRCLWKILLFVVRYNCPNFNCSGTKFVCFSVLYIEEISPTLIHLILNVFMQWLLQTQTMHQWNWSTLLRFYMLTKPCKQMNMAMFLLR